MANAYTLKQITALTDDQLIEGYDHAATYEVNTTQHFRDEMNRRSNDRLGKRMLHLTFANAALAAVAVVVAIIALIKG